MSNQKPFEFKTYRPASQTFMGTPRSGRPYLVQMNEGYHRYLFSDGTFSAWSHEKDKDLTRYIKNGTWCEVFTLPEIPWIVKKV